jgi:hypothetical protein
MEKREKKTVVFFPGTDPRNQVTGNGGKKRAAISPGTERWWADTPGQPVKLIRLTGTTKKLNQNCSLGQVRFPKLETCKWKGAGSLCYFCNSNCRN